MPPKAVKAVRILKDKPEPVYPAKHSWLWRQSRLVKAWEQRWYCMDRQGFVYAKSPQGLSLSKPVFGADVRIKKAQADNQTTNMDGIMMWGFTVLSDDGSKAVLYSDKRVVRDQWVTAINTAVKSRSKPQYLHDRFDIDYDHPLGSGLFAVVLRADEKATNTPVAIKVIKADAYREYKDLIDREVMVWHAVGSHPHIVRLHEVMFSSSRVYFIAELLSGGDLIQHLSGLQSYTESDVAVIIRQVLSAVQHMHSQGLVHMDLKPENIMFLTGSADSSIKVVDFSLSSFIHTATEPGGTPEFVCPEMLRDPETFAENGCGPPVDIWAVGIITFYLLCGVTPFQAEEVQDIIDLVKSGRWSFQPGLAWADVSQQAKDFVHRLLCDDPTGRPSAAALLTHPWLQTAATTQPGDTKQLTHALREFKAQLSGGHRNLRTSWVKRSGVMKSMDRFGAWAVEHGAMPTAMNSVPQQQQQQQWPRQPAKKEGSMVASDRDSSSSQARTSNSATSNTLSHQLLNQQQQQTAAVTTSRVSPAGSAASQTDTAMHALTGRLGDPGKWHGGLISTESLPESQSERSSAEAVMMKRAQLQALQAQLQQLMAVKAQREAQQAMSAGAAEAASHASSQSTSGSLTAGNLVMPAQYAMVPHLQTHAVVPGMLATPGNMLLQQQHQQHQQALSMGAYPPPHMANIGMNLSQQKQAMSMLQAASASQVGAVGMESSSSSLSLNWQMPSSSHPSTSGSHTLPQYTSLSMPPHVNTF